jgi:predicted transcriptional regulator
MNSSRDPRGTRYVLGLVCAEVGEIALPAVYSRERGTREEQEVRQLVQYLSEQLGETTVAIADQIGVTHQAVSSNLKTVRERLASEPGFRTEVEALLRKCRRRMGR